ncbi:MAG: T9SS type A sorting domain-containing protein [Bacteroidetes bacterium]|nr:T9SS type A sorting domain-containing protein [Bacteroidota bacterium]
MHINGESFDDLSIFNVQIVNLQGVTCYSSQLQNNHKVDISQLSAGVYLMTIELRNGIRMNKQFVKL